MTELTTVRRIVTEFGEHKVPPELDAILKASRLRKDDQPDRRTKAGKQWSAAFMAFTEAKRIEYLA